MEEKEQYSQKQSAQIAIKYVEFLQFNPRWEKPTEKQEKITELTISSQCKLTDKHQSSSTSSLKEPIISQCPRPKTSSPVLLDKPEDFAADEIKWLNRLRTSSFSPQEKINLLENEILNLLDVNNELRKEVDMQKEKFGQISSQIKKVIFGSTIYYL